MTMYIYKYIVTFFSSKNVRYPSKFNRKKQREIKINSPEFEILGHVKANAKDQMSQMLLQPNPSF